MGDDSVVEQVAEHVEDAHRTARWLDYLAGWTLGLGALGAAVMTIEALDRGDGLLVPLIAWAMLTLVACFLLHAAAVALRLAADRLVLDA